MAIFRNICRWLRFLLRHLCRWLWLFLLVALTFGAHCWNWDQIFIEGHTYFVEADCYSRMTRVQQVMEHPLRPIRFHAFENAPEGVTPHTTAPMDWVVAGLAKILGLIGYGASSLDLAGAFVSPLLSVAFIIFLWWWSAKLDLPFRNAMLLIVALSPILTHGFLLGRPDHQALTIPFLGAALAVELALWKQPSRGWDIASGMLWGLALWVSLFEPLILLVLVLLLRGIVLRKLQLVEGRPWGAAGFAVILAFALLFDGWRGTGLPSGYGEFFTRWTSTIGELSHVSRTLIFIWTGWLLPIVPVLLIVAFRKSKDRTILVVLVVLLAVSALTFWHARWGYYLALCFALSLPWALPVLRWKPLGWVVFLVSLWPMAQDWENQLYPGKEQKAALAVKRNEAVLLRETATAIAAAKPGIILAPWWLSPPLAYWSGQPCVAGSSHQSLPGTVSTAEFYLTTSMVEARSILKRRSVTYVVVDEPVRTLDNSAIILKRQDFLKYEAYKQSMEWILYKTPQAAPKFLAQIYFNDYFRVFEFTGR